MAINPSPTDHVVEIGPGQGAITEPLLASKCRLDVVEIDRDLVSRLETRFAQNERFTLHSADALNFDFSALSSGEKLFRFIVKLRRYLTLTQSVSSRNLR